MWLAIRSVKRKPLELQSECSHRFVPMGGGDSSVTSLMAMVLVLGGDETAIKDACCSVDKVVCGSRVAEGESSDMLTIQSAMSK